MKSGADFQTMNDAYRTMLAFRSPDPDHRRDRSRPSRCPHRDVDGRRARGCRTGRGASRGLVAIAESVQLTESGRGTCCFFPALSLGNAKDNKVVAGDLAAQSHAVLDNAAAVLRAAGLSFADVVSNRVFITDAAAFEAMNAIYREYFPTNPPARATVVSKLAGSQYAIEMTMVASRGPRRVFGTAPPGVPISQAIRAGRRLFVSGVLGNTAETTGDVAAQTREVLVRINRTLQEAGALPSHVVDSLVYLRDVSLFAAMDAEYRKYFGSEFPARTTIATPLVPPDALVEIMLTAVTE